MRFASVRFALRFRRPFSSDGSAKDERPPNYGAHVSKFILDQVWVLQMWPFVGKTRTCYHIQIAMEVKLEHKIFVDDLTQSHEGKLVVRAV